jgi:hypothetical protein
MGVARHRCLQPEEVEDDSKITMQDNLEILNLIMSSFAKLVISHYLQ